MNRRPVYLGSSSPRSRARRHPTGHHLTRRGQRIIRWRTWTALAFFGLCLGALMYRAVTLTVVEDPQLDESIARQYQSTVVLQPTRGAILDRSGRELAVSVTLDSIFADPSLIVDPEEVASRLAPVLDLPVGELEQKLRRDGRFVWLRRQVDPAVGRQVTDLHIRGVRATPEAKRTYPNETAAAQLLGFVGVDGNGLEGLEARYDEILMGERETYVALRDGRRRNITPSGVVVKRSTEGHSMRLALDGRIQFIAEQALQRGVELYRPRGAFAIVMDPHNGDLLAVANAPSFDPNGFVDYDRDTYRDRALADTFEPGSTMKPFLVASALDAGVVTPSDEIFCERGRYRIGRNTIHDTHEYETLTVEQIVQLSSNIGSAKIAARLGAEQLHGAYQRCGFGRRTGIDLPGEAGGILRSWKSWRRIGLATHAFGQGISVTGIQLASAIGAIANGGTLYKPRVILEVRDRQGEIVDVRDPEIVDTAFRPDSAAAVRRMLGMVVQEGGTGTRARLDNYSCGGKTGTAQKVNSATGRYDHSMWMSSFIGFAPLVDPQVVVVVVFDEPQGKHYGGTVAGPVFKEITERTLQALGVPPTELAVADEDGADGEGQADDGDADAAPVDGGDEEELTTPSVAPTGAESGDGEAGGLAVDELTDDLLAGPAMPDLSGRTMRAALEALADRSVVLHVEGSGFVAEQTPLPGVPLRDGDPVSLVFAIDEGTER